MTYQEMAEAFADAMYDFTGISGVENKESEEQEQEGLYAEI